MASESSSAPSEGITLEKVVLFGGITAGFSSILWGLIAQYLLGFHELVAWGPIIAFVVITVAYGIAVNLKTDTGRVVAFMMVFLAYVNAAYAIVNIIMQIVYVLYQTVHEFVLMVQAFNNTLKITFQGFTSQLQVIANNQRAFIDKPYGKFFLTGEIAIALIITIISVYVFVVNKDKFGSDAQALLKTKWVIGVTWFFYALARGYNTMLPLFVFAVLAELYGEGILKSFLRDVSVAAHNAAERHAGRTVSNFVTATVISLAILVVGVATTWYVAINILFTALPFTTLVFCVAGVAVGRLIHKK